MNEPPKLSPLETLRHSAAHILAQAVKQLYPETKISIGPPIDEGFYYDFDRQTPFAPEDLEKIEKRMKEIITKDYRFERSEVAKEEARKVLERLEEPYKLEILDGIADPIVSFYKDGDFVDLCEGPHVGSTGEVKAVKLLSVAGAYWRGSEKNKMLQRIYGTAFPTEAELHEFLRVREEAKLRDHRRLMVDLELMSIKEEAGAGLVFYHPKGALVRYLIEEKMRREHLKRGYQFVSTPHLLKSDVWIRSGHYQNYKDLMFIFKNDDGQEYGVKPMNCPGHILIYQSRTRSYREFPLRFFELGNVYRNEKSGVLHGTLRVRGFTQDDAHIFIMPEQLEQEVNSVLDFTFDILKQFGFTEYEVTIGTRPEKAIGTEEQWAKAEETLQKIAQKWFFNKGEITFNLEHGGGAFYGPKIDIKLKDAIGRFWQCSTIQLDFNLPERFDLNYIGQDGRHHRPLMIHRAILGSVERFIGTLIEHYAGAFPLWLAPIQAAILPITGEQLEYARSVDAQLRANGLRTLLGEGSGTISRQIRDCEVQKIPYMLVVGAREAAAGTVAVRARGSKRDEGAIKLKDFLEKAQKELSS